MTAQVSAEHSPPNPRRTLGVAGTVHAVHDGYTDLIYILLPVWQAEFGLGYGLLALLRGFYAGAMAALQIPATRLAARLGGTTVLALGTLLAAFGYVLAGISGGLIGLSAALILSGAGSSTQHPIASAAVSHAYGPGARGPLGTYNFMGDIGKAALPALMSMLLIYLSWRQALWIIAAVGVAAAVMVALWLPGNGVSERRAPREHSAEGHPGRKGFRTLFAIGMLDTGVRMGFLTFLPFLLAAKGASLPTTGLALSVLFIGGAFGKFSCGWLGARIGVLRTVLLTETATAVLIFAVLVLPLAPTLLVLPLLGVALNGTSSVLYGTVPELAAPGQTERAFAIFYTGVLGSGAVSPVLYGLMSDAIGLTPAVVATGVTSLAIIPLAFILSAQLNRVAT